MGRRRRIGSDGLQDITDLEGSVENKRHLSEALNTDLTCNSSPRQGADECSQETVGDRDTANTACDVETRPGNDANQAENGESHPNGCLIL